MKIFCIGRNYAAHAKELNNSVPTEPVVFMKPITALHPKRNYFFIPDFSENVHYETEVVIKIGKNGRSIDEQFAHKYIGGISLGIDFTARDLQKKCKEKGLPWEIAKAFDYSAQLGPILELDEFKDINQLNFSLTKNGEEVQNGNTKNMLFSFSQIIAYVSKFFTLNQGDLIYTGTPEGVGKIEQNDVLEGYLENRKMFTLDIK